MACATSKGNICNLCYERLCDELQRKDDENVVEKPVRERPMFEFLGSWLAPAAMKHRDGD